jgi:hypothetical protein
VSPGVRESALAELGQEAASAGAAAAAAGEAGQITTRMTERARSRSVAAGRGAGLGSLPLTTPVGRRRRRERLLEVAGQHFVNKSERHSCIGRSRAMDGPPTRVGGQNLRSAMLGREQIAGQDDFTPREGAEPALNEAVQPAQVQEQLGGRVRNQLVSAVTRISAADH